MSFFIFFSINEIHSPRLPKIIKFMSLDVFRYFFLHWKQKFWKVMKLCWVRSHRLFKQYMYNNKRKFEKGKTKNMVEFSNKNMHFIQLTLSWQRSLSYRNQSTDLVGSFKVYFWNWMDKLMFGPRFLKLVDILKFEKVDTDLDFLVVNNVE